MLAKYKSLDCISGMIEVSEELISSEAWLINWRDLLHATAEYSFLPSVTHGQSHLLNFPLSPHLNPCSPTPYYHFQLYAFTGKSQLGENWHQILQSTSINYLKQYLPCCFILSNMKCPRLQLGISITVWFQKLFLHTNHIFKGKMQDFQR